MNNLWAFFQLCYINDDAEDISYEISLFYPPCWYNGLPDASIKTMDRLEEVFLK